MNCEHCGYDIKIQPPLDVGCNHVYYPHYCRICSDNNIKKMQDECDHVYGCIKCGYDGDIK